MADFQRNADFFDALDAWVIAASADPIDGARKMVEQQGLSFPIAFDLDAPAVAERLGCFYQAEEAYLHACGFILRPSGAIALAVYSTGPAGRLTADDCLNRITKWSQE